MNLNFKFKESKNRFSSLLCFLVLILLHGYGYVYGYELNVSLDVVNWIDIPRHNEPVSSGIPLPNTTIYDLNDLALVDQDGNVIPAQFRWLSKWWYEKNRYGRNPSIKWVLVDFQYSVEHNVSKVYLTNKGNNPLPSKKIELIETDNYVAVNTGTLNFTISKISFNLFDKVWIDLNGDGVYSSDELIIDSSIEDGGFLTTSEWEEGNCSEGSIYSTNLKPPFNVTVLEKGPLKVVIRVEGRHYTSEVSGFSKGVYGYEVLITAYAGKSYVDVAWSVTNTEILEGYRPASWYEPPDVYKLYV